MKHIKDYTGENEEEICKLFFDENPELEGETFFYSEFYKSAVSYNRVINNIYYSVSYLVEYRDGISETLDVSRRYLNNCEFLSFSIYELTPKEIKDREIKYQEELANLNLKYGRN